MILLGFANVISGYPVHVLYLQLETCKVVSIRSIMEMNKLSGVEWMIKLILLAYLVKHGLRTVNRINSSLVFLWLNFESNKLDIFRSVK